MYNFMIPTQLKNWIDLIARAGITFRYTQEGPEGMVTGKRVIFVITSGGVHAKSTNDHIEPYLRTVLGFLGMTGIEVVRAEGLAMGEQRALEAMSSAKQELLALVE